MEHLEILKCHVKGHRDNGRWVLNLAEKGKGNFGKRLVPVNFSMSLMLAVYCSRVVCHL